MAPKKKKGTARRTRGLFADTSGWYALVDESDPDHPRARDWFKQNRLLLITTDYIFDETVTLIRTSLGHGKAVKFAEKLLARQCTFLL